MRQTDPARLTGGDRRTWWLTGILNENQYDLAIASAAALVAAYGLVGSSTSPSRLEGSSV